MKKLIKMIIPKGIWQSLVYFHCKLIKIQEEIYYFIALRYYSCTSNAYKYLRLSMVYDVHQYSMIDMKGLLATFEIAKMAAQLQGCFVECGVARGGCGALMAKVSVPSATRRHTWLFDSYEGLPKPSAEDKQAVSKVPNDRHSSILSEGYCLGTLEEVNNMLYNHFGLDKCYVHTVKGWFNNTLPEYKDKIGKIAFLKMDADWYESVKCCFENLWDNIVEGGYIYIDDYHLEGCEKATLEFLYNNILIVGVVKNGGIKPDGRGGAWFRK